MRGIVPDIVLDRRDKIGFETPMNELIANLLKTNKMTDFKKSLIFDEEEVRKRMYKKLKNSEAYSAQDWRILNLSIWMRNNFNH